ncbi:unnamed protein product [Ranitomeya imitator]|uniref:Cadherin domain-containing protein n=1 Tax=Ranitomeya imitator TaxID=111125 RepID=A0ABN9LVX6_9NEOB|nr:unnamed protein product [Ranitomeya imitator]
MQPAAVRLRKTPCVYLYRKIQKLTYGLQDEEVEKFVTLAPQGTRIPRALLLNLAWLSPLFLTFCIPEMWSIFLVTVSDGGPSPKHSTVWVVVQVLDENDNKPQFPEKVYQIKLPERDRKKRGEPIYRAFAFDKDEGPNAEISYTVVDGNEDGKFFIDPKTGMVSSRKQFSAGSYDILTIKAVDNGRPQKSSTARLHIEWIKRSLRLHPRPLLSMNPSTILQSWKVIK